LEYCYENHNPNGFFLWLGDDLKLVAALIRNNMIFKQNRAVWVLIQRVRFLFAWQNKAISGISEDSRLRRPRMLP